MSVSERRRQAMLQLLSSTSAEEQLALRERLRGSDYYQHIRTVCLNNPFFKLVDDELAYFASHGHESELNGLILARDAASKSRAPKVAVFCMPKSGSSFVQSALQTALDLPLMSLTSVANPRASSRFGMNSREQELDEFAIVRSILAAPEGFVAQLHTRCSPYLARQLAFYGISPILTFRNILDCIVSFDEMMIAWREAPEGDWTYDAQFPLPMDYPELDEQARYAHLARTYGAWLIGFYISWRRCIRAGLVNPMVLQYETDILDPREFVRKVASMTRITPSQLERLEQYAANPDRTRSRLSVGVKGRGARIGEPAIQGLIQFARTFGDELPPQEIRYLIR